ncbi:MAG: hypothetical protein CVV52_02755 [Spirochaetae bacterium HGW-Spirochaetae-8]|jgi:4-hydroxy-tetrahydrodipicolinate synthase|nr:MAG: hypothetical protein CVV52_02755 [Spirochaetae bacterium HGW-Spirochaetae-8]
MAHEFSTGFYTALGTGLQVDGRVQADSLRAQIDDQIAAGVSGLLVMGSMGIEAYIRDRHYAEVATVGSQQVQGRVPVMVGVMDTCIGRVLDRIEALKGLPIDGVVATTPFYNTLTQAEVYTFYSALAKASPYPVYMYDLAVVTKTPIAYETAARIRSTLPNVRGIKSGNLNLVRSLTLSQAATDSFSIMYSSLDTFDIAYRGGITRQLDGMFACTAPLARTMYNALRAGDGQKAADALEAILRIRDVFISVGVFTGFTAAMNLLGYAGAFHPDYAPEPTAEVRVKVKDALVKEGLL